MDNTSSSKKGSASPRPPATDPKLKPKPTGATSSLNPAANPSPKTNGPPSNKTFVDEDGLPLPRLPEIARRTKPSANESQAPRIKPVLVPPTSDMAVINNLIARELLDNSGPIEPVSPTIAVLCSLIERMSRGQNLTEIKDQLTTITTNQKEKSEIYSAILNLIDQERSMDSVVARAHIEKLLKRCSMRGDMSSAELLVAYRLHNEAIEKVQGRQSKTQSVDTVTIVEKVDVKNHEDERHAQQRWENTTPQGREIIRKKLFTLKREIMAQQQAAASAEVIPEISAPQSPKPQ